MKSEVVNQRLEEIWSKNTKGYLGAKNVLLQSFDSRPAKIKKSPKAPFYSGNRLAIIRERKAYKLIVEAYREASERFRLGEYTVEFPEFTFKPPLHYEPRPG